MSNYLAIATVTAALKQIIQEAANVIGGAEVKLGRPETKELSFNGIHLYLYMVRPNAGLSNQDLASRTAAGTLIRRPQSALNLYYIITFYGDESQLIPQRLMGSTITALLAQPGLSRERIREVTNPAGLYDFLADSDLEQQIESVKFTQIFLNNEDFSRLWSVFIQIPHQLFITYQASVIVLEPQLPLEQIPLMKTPKLHTQLGAI